MSSHASETRPLYSSFGNDPDLGELVELFVEEMPDRIEQLRVRYINADWDGLQRFAHQLKGAAGSYGFDQLTPAAGRLEESIRFSQPEDQIRAALDSLIDLCERVRPGVG